MSKKGVKDQITVPMFQIYEILLLFPNSEVHIYVLYFKQNWGIFSSIGWRSLKVYCLHRLTFNGMFSVQVRYIEKHGLYRVFVRSTCPRKSRYFLEFSQKIFLTTVYNMNPENAASNFPFDVIIPSCLCLYFGMLCSRQLRELTRYFYWSKEIFDLFTW